MEPIRLDLRLPLHPAGGDGVELSTGVPLAEHLRPLFRAEPSLDLDELAHVLHLAIDDEGVVIELDGWGKWGLTRHPDDGRLRLVFPRHQTGRAQRWLHEAEVPFSVHYTEDGGVVLDLYVEPGVGFGLPPGPWGFALAEVLP